MANIKVFKAQKIDKKTKEVLKEFVGTAEDISRTINCSYSAVINAANYGHRTKGYNIEKLGKFVEQIDLFEDGKLIDSNSLDELAKRHYFVPNTLRVAMLYQNGKCYEKYQVKRSGTYKFIEEEQYDKH